MDINKLLLTIIYALYIQIIYIVYIHINLKHSKDVILNVPQPNTLYKYLIWQLKVYSLLIVSGNSRVYVIPVAATLSPHNDS